MNFVAIFFNVLDYVNSLVFAGATSLGTLLHNLFFSKGLIYKKQEFMQLSKKQKTMYIIGYSLLLFVLINFIYNIGLVIYFTLQDNDKNPALVPIIFLIMLFARKYYKSKGII